MGLRYQPRWFYQSLPVLRLRWRRTRSWLSRSMKAAWMRWRYTIIQRGQSHHPDSKRDAVALAERLVSQGHSIDIGLMQVNAANVLPDVSLSQAFDRNRSVRIGAHLLSEAYGRCGGRRALTTMQKERALRCAAARYNRGSDGPPGQAYAARVWRVAERLVPSITQLIQSKAGRRSRWSQSHRRHHA
jgi:type IV secretion system protein VirB1